LEKKKGLHFIAIIVPSYSVPISFRGRYYYRSGSVKKELIGNFKNNGKEWRSKNNPRKVNTHDFPDKEKGKAAPYGVYDISANKGWVSVSISHDTAEFAVETVRKWWKKMGKPLYSKAQELFITADCGGSNGYRIRLWKWNFKN